MENSEPTIADEPAALTAEPEAEPTIEPQPKSRGRPVGAKDRQPRTRRPTIRVEPLPEPTQPPPRAPLKPRAVVEAAPIATPPPEPVEEPPSPRTLYRETSQRLMHLRGLLNESRRASVAEKYTSGLSMWGV